MPWARFDDLLRRIGLANGGTAGPASDAPATPTSAGTGDETERLATLQALAEGTLDVEDARRRLGGV